ncbi:MAG: SGNH/GDSL hydrolase family protein [Kiritimatiellales bacterium]
MKNRLRIFLTIVLFVVFYSASGRASPETVPPFNNGDTVAFIGDSITHGGSYHANIFLFYATRFPDRKFKYYNCGISGDTALGAIARFDQDIAVHHPNVATIMLGMNDVGRGNYGKEKRSPSDIAAQDKSFAVYKESMDRLASMLTNIGSRIIFITPSIYDQTARISAVNNFGVDDGLIRFSGFVKTLAQKYNSPVVDFHTIMLQVNHEIQKNNPGATLIGPDRIHPGIPGHFVMAYEFLRAQQMPKYVSGIGIDAAAAKPTETVNCEVGPIRSSASNGIAFSCREFALPFPVSEAQKQALAWVPFQQDLNQEVLTVKNLAAGLYCLKIDGLPVSTNSAADLARGINLSDCPTTPQYRQALAVKALNDRILSISSKLRAIGFVRFKILSGVKTLPEDDNALRDVLYASIEKHRQAPWYGYFKTQCDQFIELRREENDCRRQIEVLFDRMDQANKPTTHQWLITPAAAAGKP